VNATRATLIATTRSAEAITQEAKKRPGPLLLS
jgi:hypothetical protein